MTKDDSSHKDIQKLILENVIEMRGELSAVAQAQKEYANHNERIKSLEYARNAVIVGFTVLTGTFGFVYVLIQDKIHAFSNLLASLGNGANHGG